MKKKFALIAVALVLLVSSLPLGAVSAQQTAPAPSPAGAPTLYNKTIKTQLVYNCGGTACFKYVQKTTWNYDNTTVFSGATFPKDSVYKPAWSYIGFNVLANLRGASWTHWLIWTEGVFFKSSTLKYAYINIIHLVFGDGTWSSDKFFYTG